MSAALKLARAHTGRVKVAVCSDHPFFSYNDWFMVTTGIPGGIPRDVARNRRLTFRYNDLASVERLFAEHRGRDRLRDARAGAHRGATDGFLHRLRELAHRDGALFVLDETITGFRWAPGGGQEVVRRRTGPLRLRQGAGQRLFDLRADRSPRDHGTGRAASRPGAGLPAVDDAWRGNPQPRRSVEGHRDLPQ